MKKLCLLLALTAVFSALPASAAPNSAVTEIKPPPWVDESEYIIFKNDSAYGGAVWDSITELRAFAENGGINDELEPRLREFLSSCGTWYATFAMRYEGGIIAMKLAQNQGARPDYIAGRPLTDYLSFSRMRDDDPNRRLSELWYLRARLLAPRSTDYLFGERSEQAKYSYIYQSMERWGFTEEDLFGTEVMSLLTAEDRQYAHERITAYAERIRVTLDGEEITFDDALPHLQNNRTMIPLRRLAELIGADVDWDNDERKITAARAGKTVIMHIGDTTAYVNDEAKEMDAAPVIVDSRTFIPARYISEFLEQHVEWIPERREVAVTEDKSLYADSNLEDWVIAMGAVLTDINNGNPSVFPGYSRAGNMAIPYAVHNLDGWNIHSRRELIDEITSLTLRGHNETFQIDTALWGAEFGKALNAKWGARGIMCWDLFRVANLVQWGYCAGYLSYNEAMAFAEPAAMLLDENFSDWDEAYENYTDGYNWWSGNGNTDTKSTERWDKYLRAKAEHAEIFDDNLFKTGVIGSERATKSL